MGFATLVRRLPVERSYVRATILFYAESRGGRPCVPIRDGYAPSLRMSSLPEDLPIRINGLPDSGVHEARYDVELECLYHPRLDYSALHPQTKFHVIEGPKVVGEGVVTSEIVRRCSDDQHAR